MALNDQDIKSNGAAVQKKGNGANQNLVRHNGQPTSYGSMKKVINPSKPNHGGQ